MKRVLFYGDSNTWGYVPGGGRIDPDQLYPAVAVRTAGNMEAVEEGLNGRATVWQSDVFPAELQGGATFAAVLERALPLQGLVIMLGTNDVMPPLNLQAREIGANLARMVETARATCQNRLTTVLVSPPPIPERGVESLAVTYGGERKILAQNLDPAIQAAAVKTEAYFFAAGQVVPEMSASDGFHMGAAAHKALGEALGALLAKLPV